MYSYDDRIRAVRLYIQYDKSAAAVIQELGYLERKTLRYWYKEYLRDNGLKKKFVRSPKYNGAQKEAAVKHYMEHGKCASSMGNARPGRSGPWGIRAGRF